jgi:hypothetical protein
MDTETIYVPFHEMILQQMLIIWPTGSSFSYFAAPIAQLVECEVHKSGVMSLHLAHGLYKV